MNQVKIGILKTLTKKKRAAIKDFEKELGREEITYSIFYNNLRDLINLGLVDVIIKKPLIVELNKKKEKPILMLIIGWDECLKK